MNTSTSEFLLLFRGSQWDKGLTPEQLQEVMDQVQGWFERLKQEGKMKGGQPLEYERKVVSLKNGRVIADGPFVESKEAIGGYLLVQAGDIDEAAAIASQCPVLKYGTSVEVRPVAAECPTFRRIQETLAQAAA